MKGRLLKEKADKLIKLYSLWHETNRADIQKRCFSVLSEILAIKPDFDLLKELNVSYRK